MIVIYLEPNYVLNIKHCFIYFFNCIYLKMNSDAHVSSQALTEIESRHQDIISLESSIKELHEIFADTAILLEMQVKIYFQYGTAISSTLLTFIPTHDSSVFLPPGGVDQQHREECHKCCRVRLQI